MTLEDAFEAALRDAGRGAGGTESDLRMAYESVGRDTRTLADELGVSRRTVQRWLKFESGGGGEARNPATSGKASDIRAMGQSEREARALDALGEKRAFDSDSVDVEYLSDDDGARRGRSVVAPLDLTSAINLYRSGSGDYGRAFGDALGASYGLPEDVRIVGVNGLTLQ